MTQQESTPMTEAMQLILENGFDGMGSAMSLIINAAMEAERTQALGLNVPYERSERRKGYANGFKPKTVNTRLGSLNLQIPQVRGDVSYYPSALDRGPVSYTHLTLPTKRIV